MWRRHNDNATWKETDGENTWRNEWIHFSSFISTWISVSTELLYSTLFRKSKNDKLPGLHWSISGKNLTTAAITWCRYPQATDPHCLISKSQAMRHLQKLGMPALENKIQMPIWTSQMKNNFYIRYAFWRCGVSCITDCPETQHVAKDGLEPLILLPLFHPSQDYKYVPPCPVWCIAGN